MKLTWRQIDPFLKAPDPGARVILVYGPDDGLMRARAKTLGLTQVSDLSDPFNVAILKSEDVAADPARLVDEANAMSMMGGKRLVRIENGADGLTPALKTYLEAASGETLVIIEAGDLSASSKLRKLCETAKNAAALPCYVADAKGAAATIRGLLAEEGYSASPDAMTWLAANLSGDHGRITSEIGKLKLYMGDQKRIEMNDAQAACGSGGADSMDDFLYALSGRRRVPMLRAFTLLNEEGVALISMLRALQTHFRRLHLTAARIKGGEDTATAMNALNPKVFFKYEDDFRAALNSWSIPALAATLHKLSDLEARSKQTGVAAETLAAQAFLSIAASR